MLSRSWPSASNSSNTAGFDIGRQAVRFPQGRVLRKSEKLLSRSNCEVTAPPQLMPISPFCGVDAAPSRF